MQEELSKNNSGEVASNSGIKAVDCSVQDPPYEWCKTYPGSLCFLSRFSSEADASWKFKIATWNINGLRAWIKVGRRLC